MGLSASSNEFANNWMLPFLELLEYTNSNPEASHCIWHLSKENQQDEANKILKNKIIEDVPTNKPLVWCPRIFCAKPWWTNINTVEPQLWTRTHLLDVNRRPLEWISQPPVIHGANSQILPLLDLLECTNCQWHPYQDMNYDELLQNYKMFCNDATQNTILQSS